MNQIPHSESTKAPSSKRGQMKWLIIAGFIAAMATAYFLLPISDWLSSFQEWVQGYGPAGWIIFILVYAVTSFFLIPAQS